MTSRKTRVIGVTWRKKPGSPEAEGCSSDEYQRLSSPITRSMSVMHQLRVEQQEMENMDRDASCLQSESGRKFSRANSFRQAFGTLKQVPIDRPRLVVVEPI